MQSSALIKIVEDIAPKMIDREREPALPQGSVIDSLPLVLGLKSDFEITFR